MSKLTPNALVRRSLRSRRECLGISQGQLGQDVGVSDTCVHNAENGGSVAAKTVLAISGVPAAYESGAGVYEPYAVIAAFERLSVRVADLEQRVGVHEELAAEHEARTSAAGHVLAGAGNGHANVSPAQLTLDETLA